MTIEELDLFEKVVRGYTKEHESEYNGGSGCIIANRKGECETCDLLEKAEQFLREQGRYGLW